MPKADRNLIRYARRQDKMSTQPRLEPSIQHMPDGTRIVRPAGLRTEPFSERHTLPVASSGKYARHNLDLYYTNDPAVAERFYKQHMASCSHIGFDLEHRPTFKPGRQPNVSLLQFAPHDLSPYRTSHPVLVFALFHAAAQVPQALAGVLRNPDVFKYGVGIVGDRQKLEFLGLDSRARLSYIEVRHPKAAKSRMIGLKLLVEQYMGPEAREYKVKTLSMTNWELPSFTAPQLKYAAMDAYCGVECWRLIDSGVEPLAPLPEVPSRPQTATPAGSTDTPDSSLRPQSADSTAATQTGVTATTTDKPGQAGSPVVIDLT